MDSTETSWPSMKRNVKFSSCHRLFACMSTGWESPGWSSFAEKDLEVSTGSKLNRNQQWTPTTSKGNNHVGVWGVTTPLCLALVRPHLEYRVHFWTSSLKSDAWKLSKVHETAIKMGQWATKQIGVKSLRELKLFIWKLNSGSSGSYNYCKIQHKDNS